MRTVELGLVILAVAAAAVPVPPAAIERFYSSGIYPPIQHTLTGATNLLPFALLDVLIVAALVTFALALVRAARAARVERRAAPLLRFGGHVAAAAALVYLVFACAWGFNYRRPPVSRRLEVRAGSPGTESVVRLGKQAAEQLNALYESAHREGWPDAEWREPRLRAAFAETQRLLGDRNQATPGRLKQTLLGLYFRWASVDGMVNPLGLEVLANPDLLPFERPFVAAHEWSHLAGYADESEANFVGWLTCVRADTASAYSGWMFLYWQVSAELPAAERAQVSAVLADGPRRDLNAVVDRLRRGQWPALQAAGWALYDRYLKANRVEQGIRSYGAVVTLILQARFDPGWIPVRRARESSR